MVITVNQKGRPSSKGLKGGQKRLPMALKRK